MGGSMRFTRGVLGVLPQSSDAVEGNEHAKFRHLVINTTVHRDEII